ncbi:FAD-dependent oxidoreductase [Methanogenium organophilum]|uniref:NAD(P)/FAD-dependent oxidoreductase n=1 Tax=Methanogenium organophilum TaxID=2199 RepID=A0A9X9S663_METOG|nr:NAD(P)/FAD-dependent oxidoreductase [Methanogenium organophilum]WAI02143.1 NAD(P)/FAD-dependent oxidoreductase [Methanogenium organophilum]
MITVIGGGPAGRIAAMRLAAHGKEVTLFDSRPEGLGGQCLHEGCMVICAQNDAARACDEVKNLHRMGITASAPSVDYARLQEKMADIQETIAGVIDTETTEAGVTVVPEHACLEGKRVFAGGREYLSEAVLIATGSAPRIPDIPGTGLTGVYTAHSLPCLRKTPRKMVIIGGGVIAAEYAYIFCAIGADVEIVARSTLLRPFPGTLVKGVRRDLRGVRIREETETVAIEGTDSVTGVKIRCNGDEDIIPCDTVLIAAGLAPRTEGISGISCGPNGEIRINDRMETNVPGVYAAGDVTGPPYLTPVARREGRRAADAILGLPLKPAPACIPQTVRLRHEHSFALHPDAKGNGIMIPSPAGPGSFWLVPDRNTGRSLLMTEKETGRMTGFYEAAPQSSSGAGYLAYLINEGIPVDAMEPFMEVHPSAEGITWLMRYSAEQREHQ